MFSYDETLKCLSIIVGSYYEIIYTSFVVTANSYLC